MSRCLLPNSTQIPDVILDEWMAKLSGAEFKVVMFIARKTFGWGKSADALSVGQIVTGTGLSRRAVIDACAALSVGNGPVKCIPSDLPNGHPMAWNTYALDTEWHGETPATHAEIAPVQKSNPCKKSASTRANSAPEPVQKLHPQETPIQETLNKKQEDPLNPPQAGDSQSSRRSRKAVTLSEAQQRLFDSWYARYPNKVNRQKAVEAWARLSPDADTLRQMADGLCRWEASRQWRDGAIQHPATWLNARAWEDTPIPVVESPSASTTARASPAEERAARDREANRAFVASLLPQQPPAPKPLEISNHADPANR